MEKAIASAGKLKPEIRLAKAISEFGASLSAKHAVAFKNFQSQSHPLPQDVIRVTEELNRDGERCHKGWKPFGTRLFKILERLQLFTRVGDVLIGGSQNLIASGVWAAMRLSLQLATAYVSFFDKVTMIWMNISQATVNHEKLAAHFPQSRELQNSVCEYLICVVQLCKTISDFTAKSVLSQLVAPMVSSRSFDKEVSDLCSQFDLWSACINQQVTTLVVGTNVSTARDLSRLWTAFNWKSKAEQVAAYESKRLSLMQRLSPRQREFQSIWRRERKKGSVAWLFADPIYQAWWKHEHSCSIIIHGSVGSGKTVLMANLVGHLHVEPASPDSEASNRPLIACFFCQKLPSRPFDSTTVLGSLLQQLLGQLELESLTGFLDEIPDLDADVDNLVDIIAKHVPADRHCYIILDGLDALEESSPDEVEALLDSLRTLFKTVKLHLCFSTRTSSGIRPAITSTFASEVISMLQSARDIEIAKYIDAEVDRRTQHSKLSPRLTSLVKETLIAGADGMYLWAALQIENILPLYCQRVLSHQDIEQLLERLPPGLEDVYDALLGRIDDRRYNCRLFQLAATSIRPLTTEEVAVALNVEPGNTVWNPSSLPTRPSSVVASCGGGILEVDEEDGAVHYVHHSAVSYLTSCTDEPGRLSRPASAPFAFITDAASEYMGNVCITYLNLNVHDRRLVRKQQVIDATTICDAVKTSTFVEGNETWAWALSTFMQPSNTTRPRVDLARILRDVAQAVQAQQEYEEEDFVSEFMAYANEYWSSHLTPGIPTGEHAGLLRRIIDEELHHVTLPWTTAKQNIVEWCLLTDNDIILGWLLDSDSIFDDGRNHLDAVTAFFRTKGQDMEIRWSGLSRALNRLIWVDSRDLGALRGLLKCGADPSEAVLAPERDWDSWNSLDLLMQRMQLTWEESRGSFSLPTYTAMVEALLEHGAPADGIMDFRPLVIAIQQDWTDVATALLSHGASPHQRDAPGNYLARPGGDILRRKYPHGADEKNAWAAPLQLALATENLVLIRDLLRREADPNHGHSCLPLPLFSAIEKRSTTCMELLIGAGADVNLHNMDGMTPLGFALSRYEQQDEWIVELLLSRGADPSIKFVLNGKNCTAADVAFGQVPSDLEYRLAKPPKVNS